MKCIKLYILIIILSCANVHTIQIDQATMRQASQTLTQTEAQLLKDYLYLQLERVKDELQDEVSLKEKAHFEELVNLFYQQRYEQLLKQLSTMGYDPQDILKSSALRIAMLSGTLEQTPWFLREIAGLDWFFERDLRRNRKKWPKAQDKLAYLITLFDQLERNQNKVFNTVLVRDAYDTLEKHINILAAAASKTLKHRFAETLARIQAARAEVDGMKKTDQ